MAVVVGQLDGQEAEEGRELDDGVERHRRRVLERIADGVADDGGVVQRREDRNLRPALAPVSLARRTPPGFRSDETDGDGGPANRLHSTNPSPSQWPGRSWFLRMTLC
jgi:hypothetical protein